MDHLAAAICNRCRLSSSPRTRSRSQLWRYANATLTVARARSLRVRLSRWRWQRSTRASVSVRPDHFGARHARGGEKSYCETPLCCNLPCIPNMADYISTAYKRRITFPPWTKSLHIRKRLFVVRAPSAPAACRRSLRGPCRCPSGTGLSSGIMPATPAAVPAARAVGNHHAQLGLHCLHAARDAVMLPCTWAASGAPRLTAAALSACH